MTPQELRERAWKNIESARKLLDSDPDLAAQTVGFAAEYTLKARYCTRNGWSDFPDDRAELKARGAPAKLFTHDLDELLKFTDDLRIKTTTMHNVGWNRAADWDVERRYQPVGTQSREKVEAQVNETEKLFIELAHWEIVEKLREIEIDQAKQQGPFNFFAFVLDRELGGWAVWLATWRWCCGPRDDLERRLQTMVEMIKSVLEPDLFACIKQVRHIEPQHPMLKSFYASFQALTRGPIQHQVRCITSHNVVVGMPAMPPAYIITCTNWDRESVLKGSLPVPIASGDEQPKRPPAISPNR
jgi:hypothetical protein